MCSRDTTKPSDVLTFLSRAAQLGLRGRRNYNRYLLVTKKFVAVNADGCSQLRAVEVAIANYLSLLVSMEAEELEWYGRPQGRPC